MFFVGGAAAVQAAVSFFMEAGRQACDEVRVTGMSGHAGDRGELHLLAACGIGNRMIRPVYHR